MKKTNGFTLVELLVAMMIIAIAAVGSFEFFIHSARSTRNIATKLMAGQAARGGMDRIAWEFYGANESGSVPLPNGPFKDKHGGNRTYTVARSATGGYMVVTVTVDWD